MRIRRSVLALLLAPVCHAGDIYPVKGDPIKGEIVSVSDKEVVFTQGDKKVTRPIKEVLKIDYRDVGRPAPGTTYSSIELTDGTQLLCSKYLLKKKELEMTLLAGPTLKLPVEMVANILNNAQLEANRNDWKSRVFDTRGKEAIVINREGNISNLLCTLGEGDAAGTRINFAVTLDGVAETSSRALEGLQGVIFKHTLAPKAKPMVCKLLDTIQDVVMVSSVTPKGDGGLTVETPAGAKLDFTREQVARLDYTPGKLEYLSDLMPLKVVTRSNLDDGDPDQWHVYKDTNLNKGRLALGGTTFARGLALKPYSELTYNLKGEYREFEATVGIDDNVKASGVVTLTVEGDGKELATVTISSEEKKPFKNVLVNVKDVQKFRIAVKAGGLFDYGVHLDLADAKVRKEDVNR